MGFHLLQLIFLKFSRYGKTSSNTKFLNLEFVTYMYRGNTKLIIKGVENEAITLGLKSKGLK